MKVKVTLSWPSRILNPNSRVHWGRKHEAAKAYGTMAFYAAKKVARNPFCVGTDIQVEIVFHPPDKRHRDGDNMLGSIKYGLDGIAAAWGLDDYWFKVSYEVGERVRSGEVEVLLSQA